MRNLARNPAVEPRIGKIETCQIGKTKNTIWDRRIEEIEREIERLERWERDEGRGVERAGDRTVGKVQGGHVTGGGVTRDALPGAAVGGGGPKEALGGGEKGQKRGFLGLWALG